MATMEMDETKIKMFVEYVEDNLCNILNNKRYKVLRKIGILASGGKDSLALLDICLPILERRDIEYDILHIGFPEKICKYASMTEYLKKYLRNNQSWESNEVILNYLRSKDISFDETIYCNKNGDYIQEELWKNDDDIRRTEPKKFLTERYNYIIMLSSRQNENFYILKNLKEKFKKLGYIEIEK